MKCKLLVYVCKGLCVKYKYNRSNGKKIYQNGGKRCDICDIPLDYDGKWCPCCGVKLRQKPHKLIAKGMVARVK